MAEEQCDRCYKGCSVTFERTFRVYIEDEGEWETERICIHCRDAEDRARRERFFDSKL